MAFRYQSLRTTPPVRGYFARLDAGAVATDQFTANGSQDGTFFNGATRSGSPLAYSFDGVNDGIGLGVFAPGNAGTVHAWMRTTTTSAGEFYGVATRDPNRIYLGRSGGNCFLRISDRTAVGGSVSFPSNTWMALAVTWYGGDGKAYVNGAEVGTFSGVNWSPGPSFGLNATAIGAYFQTATTPLANFWTGLVDDVLFYNVELSATDIGRLHSQIGAIYELGGVPRLVNGGLINGGLINRGLMR